MWTQVKRWWPRHMSSLQPPPWQPPQSSPTRACYLWQRLCSLLLAYFVVLPEPSALLTVDPALCPAEKQLYPRADKTCHFNGFLLFLTAKWRQTTSNRKVIAVKTMGQVLNFTRGNLLVNIFLLCPYTSYRLIFSLALLSVSSFYALVVILAWHLRPMFLHLLKDNSLAGSHHFCAGYDLSSIPIHGHI